MMIFPAKTRAHSTLVGIKTSLQEASHSFRNTCDKSAVSLLESGEQRYINTISNNIKVIVQELCESRGGRPGLSVPTSLLVSVDVKLY